MKKYPLLVATLLVNGILHSQMSSRIEQVYLDPSVLNPAAMNSFKSANVSMFFNRVYSAVKGAPENALINAAIPLDDRTSFGVFYLREKAGFGLLQNMYASYAYGLPLSENTKLSFGLSLGFMNQSFDASKAIYIQDNDPVIQSLLVSPPATRVDLRTSAFLESGGFMAGLSFNRFVKPRFDYSYYNYAAKYELQNLANLMLGYKAELSENLSLTPFVSVLTWDFNYARIQGNVSLNYSDKIWGGFSANDAGQLGFNAGVNLGGNMKFGYAFTFPTKASTKTVIGNGHEMMLSIGLGGLKASGKTKSGSDENESDGGEEVTDNSAERKKVDFTVAGITDIKNAGFGLDTSGMKITAIDKSVSTQAGFYLVAGVFASEANADKMIKSLYMSNKASYKFHDPKNGSYYVYVKQFKSRAEADKFLMGNDSGLPQAWIREVK